MKQYLYILLFLIFLFQTNSYSIDKKIIIANGEWPPYFSQDLPNYGEISYLVTKAFKTQEIDVEYKFYPWNRSYELVKRGNYIATIGWSKNKDREKYFLFSNPILSGNVAFFYLNDKKFNWNNFNDLKDLKIGTVIGYKYDNKINELKEKHNVKIFEINDENRLFHLLINKRFDLAILNQEAGISILNKNFNNKKEKKVVYNSKPFHVEHLRVLFNKENPKSKYFLENLNKGLKILEQNK